MIQEGALSGTIRKMSWVQISLPWVQISTVRLSLGVLQPRGSGRDTFGYMQLGKHSIDDEFYLVQNLME